MSWVKTAKNLIGWEAPQKKTGPVGELLNIKTSNSNMLMIGTPGAAKTTHLCQLLIAGDRLVDKTPPDKVFDMLLEEGGTNLEHDKSALRAGHFPPKTSKLKGVSTVEPALTFKWADVSTILGRRIETGVVTARMSVADLAGEDLIQLIEKVNAARTYQDAEKLGSQKVTSLITNASAFMFIVKAPRLQGLGDEPLEAEPTDDKGLSIYSDANFKRMLNGIIRYKRQNHSSPPIRSIAFVLTAWDQLQPWAENIRAITGKPFDPIDDDISEVSLSKLIAACLPSTHAAIKSLGIPNVRYFPSWVELEPEPDPITKAPRIKRYDMFDPENEWADNVNQIKYSEKWCWREIGWIRDYAVQGA